MSSTQFETGNMSHFAHSQRDSAKRKVLYDADDEETNHAPVKKTPKKKNTNVVQDSVTSESKRSWLHEKAAESVIPTEENAKIVPDRLFKGLDPLIVHMCTPCKKFNAAREVMDMGAGMIQIPLALCTVCRGHLIAQKNVKFYQHDCPSLKKMLNL